MVRDLCNDGNGRYSTDRPKPRLRKGDSHVSISIRVCMYLLMHSVKVLYSLGSERHVWPERLASHDGKFKGSCKVVMATVLSPATLSFPSTLSFPTDCPSRWQHFTQPSACSLLNSLKRNSNHWMDNIIKHEAWECIQWSLKTNMMRCNLLKFNSEIYFWIFLT